MDRDALKRAVEECDVLIESTKAEHREALAAALKEIRERRAGYLRVLARYTRADAAAKAAMGTND